MRSPNPIDAQRWQWAGVEAQGGSDLQGEGFYRAAPKDPQPFNLPSGLAKFHVPPASQ
jgi:hypothetical protein